MNDGASRNANYYDLDDIVIEEELVPVVFHKSANGVKVDPSAEKDCVEEGAKVELPFWLARELYLRQAVSINSSLFQSHTRTRREIQADAANVDLRSRCSYFYEFGCKIAPLVGDRTIGKMLLSTFQMRYQDILTKAHRSVCNGFQILDGFNKRRNQLV
ncbi:hypothetical protein Pint_06513 [Pistacia integerrima]|uniref:Uncharacterized protein n=1 Tax=Pistacia integerrima TaxID=434235 RepID=A0ACC0Z644_9ROSI|nr:hypothetical protein Pint_06513 [Pistacia integerrima]